MCNKLNIVGLNSEIKSNIQASYLREKKSIETKQDLLNAITNAIQPYGYFSPEINLSIKNKICNTYVNLRQATRVKIVNASKHIPSKIPDFKNGQIFTSKTYNKAILWLYNYFREKGYRDVDLSQSKITINPNTRIATVIFDAELGKKYSFGKILFGKSFINKKTLKKYINFKPGEPYTVAKLQKTQENLRKSGYFKYVDITPMDEKGTIIPIKISTGMKDKIQLLMGIGYDSINKIKAIFNSKIILNSAGHIFNNIASISNNISSIQFQYLIPGIKPEEDKYLIQTSYVIDNSTSKKDASANFSLSYNKKNDFAEINFGANAIHNKQFDVTGNIYTNVFYPYFNILQKKHTQINDTIISQQWALSALIAQKGLLSSISIKQLRAEYRGKIPLSEELRLVLAGQLGINITNDPNRQPLPTLPTLGGNNGLRGYPYNSIINRTEKLQILRDISIELQKKVSHSIYATSFLDMGQISKDFNKPMLRGVGVGAVYSTSIGDINFSIAKPLDTPPDGSKKKFRFSVSYTM